MSSTPPPVLEPARMSLGGRRRLVCWIWYVLQEAVDRSYVDNNHAFDHLVRQRRCQELCRVQNDILHRNSQDSRGQGDGWNVSCGRPKINRRWCEI